MTINKNEIGDENTPVYEIKTFNELYETSVWKMVMGHVDEEIRADGEVAYVVRDLGDLVVGVMEFYENNKKRESK